MRIDSYTDFAEILEHFERQLNANGLSDIHNQVISKSEISTERIASIASTQSAAVSPYNSFLISYLSAVKFLLRNASKDVHDRVLGQINKYVHCDSGPIRSLRLSLAGELAQFHAGDSIDLHRLPDYTSLVEMISELLEELSGAAP